MKDLYGAELKNETFAKLEKTVFLNGVSEGLLWRRIITYRKPANKDFSPATAGCVCKSPERTTDKIAHSIYWWA